MKLASDLEAGPMKLLVGNFEGYVVLTFPDSPEEMSLRPMAVTWLDSEQPVQDWEWVEDLDKRECLTITSVGYYVYHTGDTLALSISKAATKHGKWMVNGLLRIPRVALVEYKWIEL